MPLELSVQVPRLYTCIALCGAMWGFVARVHVSEVCDRLKSMLLVEPRWFWCELSGALQYSRPNLDNVLAPCEASGGVA